MKLLFYASEYAPLDEIHIIVPTKTYKDSKLICQMLEGLIVELKKLGEPEE